MSTNTNAIRYIHTKLQLFLLNYVDDFLGVEQKEIAHKAYNTLGEILHQTGAKESAGKAVEPTQII